MKKSFYPAEKMTPARMEAIIGCVPHAYGYKVTFDEDRVIFEPGAPSKADVEKKCREFLSKLCKYPCRSYEYILQSRTTQWKVVMCCIVKNGLCRSGTAVFTEKLGENSENYSVHIGRVIAMCRALNEKLPDIVEKYLESI